MIRYTHVEIRVRMLDNNRLDFVWVGLPWGAVTVQHDMVETLLVGYLPWFMVEINYNELIGYHTFMRAEYTFNMN